jgi:hypothetical protein
MNVILNVVKNFLFSERERSFADAQDDIVWLVLQKKIKMA